MVEINWIDWIERFQTLIAGALALFAAIWTVRTLSHQISQAEQRHQDLIRRKFNAARAVLPLVLSRLCGYAESSILYAAKERDAVKEREPISNNCEITEETPAFPDDIIPLLKDIIEYADDKIAESTRGLVLKIQTQRSGLTSLPKTLESQFLSGETITTYISAFDQAIFNAAHLCVHASNFFDYARHRKDEAPSLPTKDEVQKKLFWLGIEESKFPEVYGCVSRHYDKPA